MDPVRARGGLEERARVAVRREHPPVEELVHELHGLGDRVDGARLARRRRIGDVHRAELGARLDVHHARGPHRSLERRARGRRRNGRAPRGRRLRPEEELRQLLPERHWFPAPPALGPGGAGSSPTVARLERAGEPGPPARPLGSEERRVGKGFRSRWWRDHYKERT